MRNEGRALPMISYENVEAAIGWLCEAFGFSEWGQRFTDADGRVTHAELELNGATVMLGWPGPDYRSPAHHASTCDEARRWLDVPWVVDGVLVTVDDIDSHYARAVAASAPILRELEDLPVGRLYTASDQEGHRWMFMQAEREPATPPSGLRSS